MRVKRLMRTATSEAQPAALKMSPSRRLLSWGGTETGAEAAHVAERNFMARHGSDLYKGKGLAARMKRKYRRGRSGQSATGGSPSPRKGRGAEMTRGLAACAWKAAARSIGVLAGGVLGMTGGGSLGTTTASAAAAAAATAAANPAANPAAGTASAPTTTRSANSRFRAAARMIPRTSSVVSNQSPRRLTRHFSSRDVVDEWKERTALAPIGRTRSNAEVAQLWRTRSRARGEAATATAAAANTAANPATRTASAPTTPNSRFRAAARMIPRTSSVVPNSPPPTSKRRLTRHFSSAEIVGEWSRRTAAVPIGRSRSNANRSGSRSRPPLDGDDGDNGVGLFPLVARRQEGRKKERDKEQEKEREKESKEKTERKKVKATGEERKSQMAETQSIQSKQSESLAWTSPSPTKLARLKNAKRGGGKTGGAGLPLPAHLQMPMKRAQSAMLLPMQPQPRRMRRYHVTQIDLEDTHIDPCFHGNTPVAMHLEQSSKKTSLMPSLAKLTKDHCAASSDPFVSLRRKKVAEAMTQKRRSLFGKKKKKEMSFRSQVIKYNQRRRKG